jgi:hypothetical protein
MALSDDYGIALLTDWLVDWGSLLHDLVLDLDLPMGVLGLGAGGCSFSMRGYSITRSTYFVDIHIMTTTTP